MRRPAAAAMGCLSVAVLGGAFHVGGRPDLPASAALQPQASPEETSTTTEDPSTSTSTTTTDPATSTTTPAPTSSSPSPSTSLTPTTTTPGATRTTAPSATSSTRRPPTTTRTTARTTAPATTPPTTPATTPPTSTTSGGKTRTVTGAKVSTAWGPVQVRITVTGTRITAATAIKHPDDNDTSVEINDYALPLLEQQVLTAQSAQIDGVSGATVTSTGYRTSLQSALDKLNS